MKLRPAGKHMLTARGHDSVGLTHRKVTLILVSAPLAPVSDWDKRQPQH